MKQQLNAGLVAFGKSGRLFHAPFIHAHPSLRLAAVVERHAEESKRVYPYVKIVRDLSTLLAAEDIDLVVITTPNILHYDMAREALNAGKHVVVEKPFTPSTEEAQQLIAVARDRELILSVYQNRRWDGDFRTVQALVKDGVLGEIVEYESHFDRYRPALKPGAWKEKDVPGAGLLYDLGSHLIDQALCLFGLPETVTADLQQQRPDSVVDDYFEVVLGYGATKAILKAGMLVRERGPRFMLHGTKGSFIKYGMDPQEEALVCGDRPGGPAWGTESEQQWGILNTDLNGLHYRGAVETQPGRYLDFYDNIFRAITAGEELAVTPEEARNVIAIIELARSSSRELRTLPVPFRD